jgi:outer membrane protein OmpA-like peptidoglycan-associated protein
MKIKKSILTCMLMLGFVSASAQETNPQDDFVFNPHWYLQVQGGAQYTLGEVSFSDLLSPNAQVTLGYNFDEVFGARLAVNAWQSKGGSDYDKDGKYSWKWKYVAPTVDLTVNLSNLFCGFNAQRFFNFSVFAGLGANIGFDNDEAATAQAQIDKLHQPLMYKGEKLNTPLSLLWDGTKPRFVGQAGIMADFRLSDAVSLGIEVAANTLSDHYNSKPAKNADWYFNALAGLKINLGETYVPWQPGMKQRKGILGRKTRVVEKIVEKEVPVEKIVEKKVYVDKIVEVEHIEPMRRDVFFTISSTRIDPTEDKKLDEIASYLKVYPNAKITVTGYADKGTGNAKINERLGKGRAQVVADRLVKQYKIDRSRIIVDSKGDTEQPFAENDKNRVTICIAE